MGIFKNNEVWVAEWGGMLGKSLCFKLRKGLLGQALGHSVTLTTRPGPHHPGCLSPLCGHRNLARQVGCLFYSGPYSDREGKKFIIDHQYNRKRWQELFFLVFVCVWEGIWNIEGLGLCKPVSSLFVLNWRLNPGPSHRAISKTFFNYLFDIGSKLPRLDTNFWLSSLECWGYHHAWLHFGFYLAFY